MSLTQKLSENTKILAKIQTADATSTVDVGWVDFTNFRKFAYSTCASALTGNGISELIIQGNTLANGTGTDVVLDSRTGLSAGDAVGDSFYQEIDVDDLVPVTACKGINVTIKTANAADDHVVTYILSGIRHAAAGQSADVIA